MSGPNCVLNIARVATGRHPARRIIDGCTAVACFLRLATIPATMTAATSPAPMPAYSHHGKPSPSREGDEPASTVPDEPFEQPSAVEPAALSFLASIETPWERKFSLFTTTLFPFISPSLFYHRLGTQQFHRHDARRQTSQRKPIKRLKAPGAH